MVQGKQIPHSVGSRSISRAPGSCWRGPTSSGVQGPHGNACSFLVQIAEVAWRYRLRVNVVGVLLFLLLSMCAATMGVTSRAGLMWFLETPGLSFVRETPEMQEKVEVSVLALQVHSFII